MPCRIWRSPYSRFGGLNSLRPDDLSDETLTAAGVYTDEVLADIAANGFNAIWLHAVLADITVVPEFPEFGKNASAHLAALNTLTGRAAKHGLKVLLYFQPVRAVAAGNTEFWKNHPDCGGQHGFSTEQVLAENKNAKIGMICLCTSAPAVKKWVSDACAFLAENVPMLGGVILITASEYHGHCYSHCVKRNPGEWLKLIECPRCREREGWEVAAELVNLVHDGLRRHSDTMDVIAWNWGWTMWLPPPCAELLELLPRDTILMAGCERGGRMDLAERPDFGIDEYSLTYAGPSPLCLAVLERAKELGMRRMVKLQLGSTHELATVAGLPLMNSIFKKAGYLRRNPDIGYMGCWNFGNMTGANTAGFNFFQRPDSPETREEALKAFASEYFKGCDAELALRAWDIFSEAAQYMPFVIPFLYNGVHSHALSYFDIYRPEPLHKTCAGVSYLDCADRGDDLSASASYPGRFSLDEIIASLGKMAVLWKTGAEIFAAALKGCDDRNEVGNAFVCAALWQSAEHAYRAYRLRLDWKEEKRSELLHIVEGEIGTVSGALPLCEKDPRQGWHGEAGVHMFEPVSMRRKLIFLKEMRTALSER